MRVIEHLRHSMRLRPDGVHLTREGVELARRVGAALGAYDRVITSDLPRAQETAVAMGFAIDETRKRLSKLGKGLESLPALEEGCTAWLAAARENPVVAQAAHKQAKLLRKIARSVPDGSRVLIVSHGGTIEKGVIGLLPEFDYRSWGPSFGYCEGVHLVFDGDACISASPIRQTSNEASS